MSYSSGGKLNLELHRGGRLHSLLALHCLFLSVALYVSLSSVQYMLAWCVYTDRVSLLVQR